jgi:hypothetical protein
MAPDPLYSDDVILMLFLKNKMWIDRATGAIMTSQALYTIIKEYDEI